MMVGQQGDTMANPEHLAKLKEGVGAWNEWRAGHPEISPNLVRAKLRRASLDGANFRGASLVGAELIRAELHRANLIGANLVGTNLVYANLNQAKLGRANLRNADLRDAILSDAKLVGANLAAAHLDRADLVDANLAGANLNGADLNGADLRNVNLRGTNLHGASLDNSDMSGAVVGFTSFGNSDLSSIKGLTTVKHVGPSTVAIDTIYRSKGRISEAFLRGCGVPDDFITYMESLTSGPLEFYSCFISYSSRDDAFSTELHAKLRGRHIRCWKDSEDLKIGDKFQEVIESAIRLHDKLLLVLSENSINSSWVEWEVRKALKRERDQGSAVLFPVRLDDAVMEAPYDWAGEVRRRHIGDFRKWKDHDSFQKSLDRLLRDLKSEDSNPK
jgi:uncharacterized protein YjbI with pentapeptide repeats